VEHPACKRYFELLRQRDELLAAALDEISDVVVDSRSWLWLFGAPMLGAEALGKIVDHADSAIRQGRQLVQTPSELNEDLELEFERLRSWEDHADHNETAYALTHLVDITGDQSVSYLEMVRQYEKRIEALTNALRAVIKEATAGLLKIWPWFRRVHLYRAGNIASQALMETPEWYDMEVGSDEQGS